MIEYLTGDPINSLLLAASISARLASSSAAAVTASGCISILVTSGLSPSSESATAHVLAALSLGTGNRKVHQ